MLFGGLSKNAKGKRSSIRPEWTTASSVKVICGQHKNKQIYRCLSVVSILRQIMTCQSPFPLFFCIISVQTEASFFCRHRVVQLTCTTLCCFTGPLCPADHAVKLSPALSPDMHTLLRRHVHSVALLDPKHFVEFVRALQHTVYADSIRTVGIVFRVILHRFP